MSIAKQIAEYEAGADIKQLVAGIVDNHSPLDLGFERMILYNEGTVQTLLSTIFCAPIKVQVISQHELADVIVRWVRLAIEYSNSREPEVVCWAESVIPKHSNPPEILLAIREKKAGIGQIISTYKLNTIRRLLSFYSDDIVFARSYCIQGDCDIFITETFPRETFKKIGTMYNEGYDGSI